jgi:hypothetical protein
MTDYKGLDELERLLGMIGKMPTHDSSCNCVDCRDASGLEFRSRLEEAVTQLIAAARELERIRQHLALIKARGGCGSDVMTPARIGTSTGRVSDSAGSRKRTTKLKSYCDGVDDDTRSLMPILRPLLASLDLEDSWDAAELLHIALHDAYNKGVDATNRRLNDEAEAQPEPSPRQQGRDGREVWVVEFPQHGGDRRFYQSESAARGQAGNQGIVIRYVPEAPEPAKADDCNCDPLAQTGGGHHGTCPAYEPECTCYELTGGHQSMCPFGVSLRIKSASLDDI